MRFLLYLMPLGLIKLIYKTLPPTGSFRTTLGRVFRLIKIDNDTCLAISSDKYDKNTIKKLMKLKKQGESMVDTAINGINLLSFENRQDVARTMNRTERLKNGNI